MELLKWLRFQFIMGLKVIFFNNLKFILLYLFLNLDSSIEQSKKLPFWEKTYFFIHHSIFIQIMLMLFLVTISLLIIHWKCKSVNHPNLSGNYDILFIEDEKEKKTIEEIDQIEEDTLSIENYKFNKFLSQLDDSPRKK